MSTQSLSIPKVAIVYDWATTHHGGAELVLTALHQVFPQAPLFTSVHDAKKTPWTKGWPVTTTFLQKLPGAKRFYRYYAPLMPLAFELLDLSAYDVILSVSSFVAKGVVTRPDQLHINYMLTPPRYLYSHRESYLIAQSWLNWPGVKWLTKKLFQYLTSWDAVAALRPDVYIPISRRAQLRVLQYYNRSCEAVIYPPFDSVTPQPSSSSLQTLVGKMPPYYLALSRLVRYKRFDLAILASARLNHPLVIGGDGPHFTTLSQLVPDKTAVREPGEALQDFFARALGNEATIFFTRTITAPERVLLMKQAKALLLPGIEDFGITALEAASLGTPSILHKKSGVAEIITQPLAGLHLQELTVSAMTGILTQFEQQHFNTAAIMRAVEPYSIAEFKRLMHKSIIQLWKKHRVTRTQ